MMRSVEYIRCKLCKKQVDVYFAHGAVQVYACNYCYKRLGKVAKLFNRLAIWFRGVM